MPGKLDVVRHCHKLKWLMAASMLKVGEPANTFDSNKMISVFINSPARSIKRIFFRDAKFPVSTMNAFPKPHFIFLDQGKHLFVRNRIHVSDDQKLLLCDLCAFAPLR